LTLCSASLPFRPCFMPVTPLSFDLQGFSLRGSGRRVAATPALHAVLPVPAPKSWRGAASRICAPVESVALDRCYPVSSARSPPGIVPSEVFTSSASTPGTTPGSPFMGFDTMASDDDCSPPLYTMSALQSFREPARRDVSCEAPLPPWGLWSNPQPPQAATEAGTPLANAH
jgi:hypothetical protein